MKSEICIVNCGSGNLLSLSRAIDKFKKKFIITDDKYIIEKSDYLLLPGDGSFRHAIETLKEKKIINTIINKIKNGTPTLGICIGMQILFSKSYEDFETKGFDIFKGEIKKLKRKDLSKVPNIGWNKVFFKNKDDTYKKFDEFNEKYFYFMHSYVAEDYDEKEILAYSNHGNLKFPCIIKKNNVVGIQFHPEKSGVVGMELLRKFIFYEK